MYPPPDLRVSGISVVGTRVWHGRPLGASGLWLGTSGEPRRSRPGLENLGVPPPDSKVPRLALLWKPLGFKELVVIYAGDESYPLASHIRAVTLKAPRDEIASPLVGV